MNGKMNLDHFTLFTAFITTFVLFIISHV